MPHVFKPTYTVPVPPNSTPFLHRGKPAVRWKGRGGTVKIGVVCKKRPTHCLVEATCWYASYRDHAGEEKVVKGYTDKAATEAMLAKLVQQAARIGSGLLPPEASSPRRSIADLLDLWKDFLIADGGTVKHAKTQRLRVERVIAAAEATRPADLTPADVVRAIAKVKEDEGLSARTAGHHLGAVKAFTRWLCVSERCEPTDHLSGLSREEDNTDPRLTRRALLPEEFDRLVSATRESERVVFGLNGFERAVLYLFASSTGLRASEIASLTASSFDLKSLTVRVAAAYAKGRRTDELDIHADLVTDLTKLLAGLKPRDKVWPDRTGNKWRVWWNLGAEMVADDLAGAGLAKVDECGNVFDFHSLRSQFATDLERAKVPLGRAQKLMRHSTPLLTNKHYTRPGKDELSADVNKLKRG